MELDGGIGVAHMIGEKAERLRAEARPASGEAAQGDPEQKRRLCIKGGVFSKGANPKSVFPHQKVGMIEPLYFSSMNFFMAGVVSAFLRLASSGRPASPARIATMLT